VLRDPLRGRLFQERFDDWIPVLRKYLVEDFFAAVIGECM
jgi:hypothetical protein